MKNKRNKTTLGNYVDTETIPFGVRVFKEQRHHYHCTIGDMISSQEDLEEAVYVLNIADENDTVTLHLNCDGGSVDAGMPLLHAIGKCTCHVHVIGTGRIASLATFIILEADSFELHPFTTILCHSASFGSSGKMQDTLEHANFTFNQCNKMLRHYYKDFLSDKEIDDIITNKKELLMDAEEFGKRCKERNKNRCETEGTPHIESHEDFEQVLKDTIYESIPYIAEQQIASETWNIVVDNITEAVLKLLNHE